MKLKVEYMEASKLKTYAGNAKRHDALQIEQIKTSIQKFGMNDPIAIWKDDTIIEGHGRLIACLELGFEEVPVIRLDSLTDEQRRAYALVHNKLTMNTGFDEGLLMEELERITNINMDELGFQIQGLSDASFDDLLIDAEEKPPKEIQCPKCGGWFVP